MNPKSTYIRIRSLTIEKRLIKIGCRDNKPKQKTYP